MWGIQSSDLLVLLGGHCLSEFSHIFPRKEKGRRESGRWFMALRYLGMLWSLVTLADACLSPASLLTLARPGVGRDNGGKEWTQLLLRKAHRSFPGRLDNLSSFHSLPHHITTNVKYASCLPLLKKRRLQRRVIVKIPGYGCFSIWELFMITNSWRVLTFS